MSLQQPNVIFPMASLYVGDLHPDVTEGLLYEKFNAAGQVISLRICRDTLTKRSLGYGYVNFSTQIEAERALDTMNFDLVKGKPMRLMWCQRNPSLRKSGIGNVFIKNLDKNIDNKAMYDTFSAFGSILSCKVALDEDGESKGYGFVHFENVSSADKAIEKVNGMLLNGKKVYVGKFLPRVERDKHLGDRTKLFTNIYVKNFDENLNDDQFHHLFSTFGKITSSVVMKQANGASKCFGFVAFEDPKSAAAAVEEMNGKELSPGQCLYVGRAQKKGERMNELKKRYEQQKIERYSRYQGTNLYIKNLDDNIDDERIKEEFSTFGTITSAKVMMENGRSKGFGFVCFNTAEEAQKAMNEMNGHLLGGKPLYVALAQRKEDRRAYLNNQFFQRYRQQAVTYTPNAPPFLIPAVQGPRFFNHLSPLQNHVRTTPRWATAPNPMRNGTIMPPLMAPYRTNAVRQQVQANNLRNVIHARPITGTQQPTSRPNSKYTNNSPSVLRQQVAGLGVFNGGDNPSPTSPQTQKEIIGERLFRVVEKLYPEMAGKITGMLLEIDNTELIQMIENQESLKRKVEEAIAVLQAHQAKKAGLVVQE